MDKSVFEPEYAIMLQLLKEERKKAGIRQIQVAKRLKTTQSKVSRMESGEYRLDILDLEKYCNAIGTDFKSFFRKFEKARKKK